MSAAGPPTTALEVPGLGRELVVVDVEGNGAAPPEIVEIGAGRVWRPRRAAYEVWMTTALLSELVALAGLDFCEIARIAGLRRPSGAAVCPGGDAEDTGNAENAENTGALW